MTTAVHIVIFTLGWIAAFSETLLIHAISRGFNATVVVYAQRSAFIAVFRTLNIEAGFIKPHAACRKPHNKRKTNQNKSCASGMKNSIAHPEAERNLMPLSRDLLHMLHMRNSAQYISPKYAKVKILQQMHNVSLKQKRFTWKPHQKVFSKLHNAKYFRNSISTFSA